MAPTAISVEGNGGVSSHRTAPQAIAKAPTGIDGLDEVLDGGLPRGRPTLVCGAAGCGKTLLGMQFLVQGAQQFGEAGVFIAFEEHPAELAANVASLGFDLKDLEDRKLLAIDHVHIDPTNIVESGDYDLEGLFLRLGLALDSVGAKRIVIDTLETLFGGLSNEAILRSELKRLFDWLKARGITAIVTAERGDGRLTRHGLEEYVSDCVIVLDHRVTGQISTRRMRVVKYRGSKHGTNEYPFLISDRGISVLPITSAGLTHKVSDERLSTGVPRLDAMLGGKGYFRGSTILVSGTAGGGKTSLAAHFAEAMCRRGERTLYFAFEESPPQIVRNMRSVGIDLGRHMEDGRLRFQAARPTAFGLEAHLALIHREIRDFKPTAVVFDPISNFMDFSSSDEAHGMLVRLVDYLKGEGLTTLFTSLTDGIDAGSGAAISSVVDTWLSVKSIETNGERNRGLYVLKSRGMAHSNQVREFVLGSRGVELLDVYIGSAGVLTGSARAAQEARETTAARERDADLEHKRRLLARKQAEFRERLATLQAEFESESFELERAISAGEAGDLTLSDDRAAMAQRRKAD